LVEEVLDELLFKRTRSKKSVEISTEELGDEVAGRQYGSGTVPFNLHVLERRDEDIAERNDLHVNYHHLATRIILTFSCRKCLSSFNSLYVLLLNTGVEKGFMIFLMATEVPDN
jgi:hypothetical protein